ncbi:MAG: hypothetical protein UY48_C0003G0070 [Candidatus Gottesmanbacteria bacterium GW2011_GWB1_49_7]|uniref:Uncharacterized protein n=1 Tax=Candidatus Gottesmanbacteria bacterium GW2011_GWB1_49_7 TaxID=1618448 RepID=A0A0G1W3H3_9BACT|nr:MAG: hypothetical protein UY48_C0003G0070 [Candidatus Gottesmanbacteria bacterium GW2011_GWB1_49_7]
MACYTRIVILENTRTNQEARRLLGLPLEGSLSVDDARRVRIEAGVLKARTALLTLAPGAFIVRDGNKLTVQVSQ